jgi:hypothetical protein
MAYAIGFVGVTDKLAFVAHANKQNGCCPVICFVHATAKTPIEVFALFGSIALNVFNQFAY